jgi:DNA-binding NarL/FixJ family response regulator
MRRTVLVVDDDGDLRDLVRIALAGHDELEVAGEAGDAATALERCRELDPDLVVLDLGLPDVADRELIAQVRGVVERASIVVFTASMTRRRDARSWGADDLVRKDADIGRLVRALEQAARSDIHRTWKFPADSASVRDARHRAADTLRGLDLVDHIQDVTLVVSELASNAVFHAKSDFEVRLDVGRSAIRVEVHDRGNGVPQPRAPGADEVGGRGLLIVGALATVWGTESTSNGKCVWAELPR